jgi:hypothetical protein
MKSRLEYLSFFERIKLTIAFITGKSNSPLASQSGLLGTVARMEAAVQSKPDEWIYWYWLADAYQKTGLLANSVLACENCYALRPKDIRSTYALATALRVLLRAKFVGASRIENVREKIAESGLASYSEFSPEASQEALTELGMTLEQAAERPLALFEEVRNAGVRGQEADVAKNAISAIYSDFPCLRKN